jgi:hypothetical protein
MNYITSAAKEVCSHLPLGEGGKTMDLIGHPGDPNSWALALLIFLDVSNRSTYEHAHEMEIKEYH